MRPAEVVPLLSVCSPVQVFALARFSANVYGETAVPAPDRTSVPSVALTTSLPMTESPSAGMAAQIARRSVASYVSTLPLSPVSGSAIQHGQPLTVQPHSEPNPCAPATAGMHAAAAATSAMMRCLRMIPSYLSVIRSSRACR